MLDRERDRNMVNRKYNVVIINFFVYVLFCIFEEFVLF